MSSKMVENSTNICDVGDTKDKSLLLVTVREGSSVLPVVLRRVSEDGKVVIGLEQVVQGGFRKIEPKPRNESNDDECDANINGGDTRSPRLLESRSTRRGVRICPTCQGRVGYRSKVCKHCLISSGNSSRSTSNAKKRRVRQRKTKANTKHITRVVSGEAGNVQESIEECHTTVSIDNFDVQIGDTKSDESLLYVHVPTTTSTLETISNIDSQFSGITNTALSVEDECPMPANANSNHGDIVYETQIRAEINKGGKSSFEKEDQVHSLGEVSNSGHELSQNLDHENSIVSNLSDMSSSQLVQERNIHDIVARNSEDLCESVDLEQDSNSLTSDVISYYISDNATNNAHGNLRNNVEKLADNVGNLANNTEDLTNVTDISENNGENLASNAEIIQCNGSTDKVQNEEEISVDRRSKELDSENPSLTNVVPQSEESNSPVLLVDVNVIGSISVTTSDDNSQAADKKEYNVSLEPETSENTFVFERIGLNSTTAIRNGEDSINNPGELDVGSEKHGSMKRKKRPRLWKEPRNRRKKPKVSSVQFVRIEPKPFLLVDEDASKNKQGVLKQNRLLSSNPTRRGVMLCPLCQKDVGCRSKTCKYCKVTINLCSTKSPLEQKNLLAVQLCKETCPQHTMFSVKKTLNASEDRCFIKKVKATEEDELSKNEADVFSCDCVENNPVEKSSCEHTLCMYRRPKITQARKIILKPIKIDSLPIDFIFKLKLGELWEKVKEKEFPLVQQVCQNTLVILDVDSNVQTTPSSCVHVRFEKIRRRSSTELHIFCSGKTCSVWNEVEEGEKDGPVTCIHYCVSLWAIASDNELQKYFKIFLDATQVYLHSEVFDSVIKE